MSFNSLPEKFYIQWHITNYCNLRCQHCYQENFARDHDRDFSGLRQIADNFLKSLRANKQVAYLNITGGEPLLKPELWPLLEYLSGQPEIIELALITNGLLLDEETISRLAHFPKLKQIKISLDGPDPQTNDSLRGPGVFLKVRKNLILLRQNPNLQSIIMFTIMQRNLPTIPSLINLAQELKVSGLILERFIPWGCGKGIKAEVLNREQWWEFLRTLSSLMGIEETDIIGPYQAFQINFEDGEPILLGAPCVLGEEGLCLMPGGEVYPCRRFPIAIGHLEQESLNQIWRNSPFLQVLRAKENLRGKCCTCSFKNCRGCRSLALALTGDYLAEDPHCPYTSPSALF